MNEARRKRYGSVGRRAGFSLVEVLVAISILLLVGGALAATLLYSFRLWEHGVSRTRQLVATAECRTLLTRDFQAALAAGGFVGDRQRCRFQILRCHGGNGNANAMTMAAVEYALSKGVLERRLIPLNGAAERRYFPLGEGFKFTYGSVNSATSVWQDDWSSSTNAPICLRLAPAAISEMAASANAALELWRMP